MSLDDADGLAHVATALAGTAVGALAGDALLGMNIATSVDANNRQLHQDMIDMLMDKATIKEYMAKCGCSYEEAQEILYLAAKAHNDIKYMEDYVQFGKQEGKSQKELDSAMDFILFKSIRKDIDWSDPDNIPDQIYNTNMIVLDKKNASSSYYNFFENASTRSVGPSSGNTALDHVLLSQCTYHLNCLGAGGLMLVDGHVPAQLRQYDNRKSGFFANIYYKDNNDGTIKTVVAFRGTNPDSVRDWFNNWEQLDGRIGNQYRDAAEYIYTYNDLPNLSYTGHSLGGGLATLAGINTRKQTYTFNAAQLHRNTMNFARFDENVPYDNMHHFRMDNDPVSWFDPNVSATRDDITRDWSDAYTGEWFFSDERGEFSSTGLPGRVYTIGGCNADRQTCTYQRFEPHDINNVIQRMRENLNRRRSNPSPGSEE